MMLQHDSHDCDRIEAAGFMVAVAPYFPVQIAHTFVSRYIVLVVSPGGRIVAELRATREGDFCSRGWVETAPGVRVEYRRLIDVIEALGRHRAELGPYLSRDRRAA